MSVRLRFCVAIGCLAIALAMPRLSGQDVPADGAAGPAAEPAQTGPAASDRQEAIRVRFERFEDTLLKMARYLQETEPARAELVLRALARSQEEQVADRMERIVTMLSKEDGKAARYADAIDEQEAILANLRELLTILRSEDILDENRKEQERLKELARQVSALIDAEKVHQADTQRGEPTDRVAEAQGRTARKTGDIVKKIDEHDRSAGKQEGEESEQEGQQDGQSGEGEQSGEGQEQQPSEGQNGQKSQNPSGKNGEKPPGENQSGENQDNQGEQGSSGQQGQPGQPGQQQEGQQGQQGQQGQNGEGQQGEPQEGQQGESQQSQSGPPRATPGREELEAAREKMERAIEELKKQNRGNASKAQEEAIRKLIEAKERIEELLRQLREEERELLLRALEARFQKMLQLQQAVLATTEELKGLPVDQWQDREFARCRDAATTEREIGIEADKALEVLRADGSSVAFPEAVEQVRDDVGEVAARLGREDAGELTVAIERDIIDALEEMILALQKEMEKLREQKQQQGQPGSPSDPALVDQLAELKMLKTLQLRINRRTKTLGRLFTGEQATKPDVIAQLRELSDRQARLQQATYDLAVGKTAN